MPTRENSQSKNKLVSRKNSKLRSSNQILGVLPSNKRNKTNYNINYIELGRWAFFIVIMVIFSIPAGIFISIFLGNVYDDFVLVYFLSDLSWWIVGFFISVIYLLFGIFDMIRRGLFNLSIKK